MAYPRTTLGTGLAHCGAVAGEGAGELRWTFHSCVCHARGPRLRGYVARRLTRVQGKIRRGTTRGERLVGAQPPQNGAQDPLRSAALPPAPSCSTRRRRDPLGEATLYAERGGEAARGARGRVGKKRSAVGALVGSAVGRQGTLVGQRYTALI